MPPPAADVLVVGGGPAGRALAAACDAAGLRTALLDPAPDRPWTATYASWAHELPADLPHPVIATRAPARAHALSEHWLGRDYAVLDTAALRAHLDARLAGVRLHVGAAGGADAAGVLLTDGSRLQARTVVDAGGARQVLAGRAPRRVPAEQTAHGVVLDSDTAAPVLAPGEALFMDWRPDHGEPGWPSFLYAVPLGHGRVLLEETSLARRPGLSLRVLRRRLHARLDRHGITPQVRARIERVRFPVDTPRHPGRHALGFGAAAPLVHPASGFNVATALTLAPVVAAALAAASDGPPNAPLRAAHRVVWSPQAIAVHRFRRIGLEALLRMPPAGIPAFFEAFFGLAERHRFDYLSARADLPATLATMTALFRRADPTLRRRLMLPAVLPALRRNDSG